MTKRKTYKTNKKTVGMNLNMKKYKEPSFTSEQLLSALYWIWDAFERASINMCVIGDTANSVINNIPLYGDKVTVAIRRQEWDSGSKSTFMSFAGEGEGEVTESGLVLHLGFNGIPVVIHILEDTPALVNPNTVIYHAEYFKFPNTYMDFLNDYPQFK